MLWLAAAPAPAGAAVTCPNSNPVVDENQCHTGTSSWQVNDYSLDLGGFTTQTSVNLGQSVSLKIARNAPVSSNATVNVAVYRMGYYAGLGGRLVHSANNVAINNNYTCNPMDPTTGKVDCGNWSTTYTVPGSALPASGVYLAKLTASTGEQTAVVFTVRDDNRVPSSRLLYVLPVNSYQAYNTFGGKNLYFGTEGDNTVSGTSRAVKVSFNRPLARAGASHDWFFGPDFDLLSWIEQQGYDASYSDDVQIATNPQQLLQHNVIVISGHSEYWSKGEFDGVKAARDAGINIASFSANTAYWKVRYEDGQRTLVCYKTVEGGGSSGSGQISANDWGPDGVQGTADDALGADGVAGTSDDNPQNSTTTWRDNGAPPGDPGAPPAGRVGPDQPENQIFGVMYVGDNDSAGFPVTVPAGNANDEFAADRVWRNTGISENSTTNIGTLLVGWEWDTIPTQAQYTSRQPANVIRLSATDVQVASDNSWLQDEGRLRNTTPPPGQPGTINAVKYRAPSGALVFASGTMQWSRGLSNEVDPRIEQATYNLISDMGVQPATPTDHITVDPGGSNLAPISSFTLSPNPAKTTQTVTFNASGSSDPDGSVVNYKWDLDADGTFELDSGSNPTVTHSYTGEGEGTYNVRLRVTDNGGATDLAVRTLTVIDNQPPSASFTVNPNPVLGGQQAAFNGSGSSDADGTITRYEWDLDGNGTYETDTGATPTTTRTYSSPGTVNAGLRVTDNGGKTATTTVAVQVKPNGISSYPDAVLDTPGLLDYWRMGESSGPTFADSAGSHPATASPTGVSFGVPGGVQADPNAAARFDGSTGSASAPVNLSSTNKVTVEFWLKWNFANDDRLAMELTNSYHDNDGGFLIDPNSPSQLGPKFAVGIGRNGSRNTAYFNQPSSGVWHHYAIVLDSSAPAATQITPYVDGQAVPYTKLDSGTGAGNFASSTLYMMSRAGTSLFGTGDLDEVAIYDRVLGASTITEHYNSYGTNRRPVADFQTSPALPVPNEQVTFDASSSHDPDGSITRYEWDLDGNGTYETDSGSNPVVTHTYTSEAPEGSYNVGLRVTDNLTGTDTVTHNVNVLANQPPAASFTINPSPVIAGQPATLNAAASNDPDGTIAKYEWDLDGNGSYETDTGTTSTVQNTYNTAGTINVGLKVTDDGGKTSTATVPLIVKAGGVSSYPDAVLDTPGLLDYWRMGESSGPTFADSAGSSPATAAGNVTFGVPGGVQDDPNAAARFDGSTSSASAPLNLSGTSKVTVEFWLKWNAYANDDRLAMEFTPNFNNQEGGFLIDPNAAQMGGSFGVGINDNTRNNVFFARPSAGAWHHYAFVLDSSAAAVDQIKPYVDGQSVPYTKLNSGTGGGNFANSTLYMMSRAGSSLFGAGDLDEVAIYNSALSASTIAEHYSSYGTNRRPVAAFTNSPDSPNVNVPVSFNAAASNDPDGSIVNYEWDLDGNGSFETLSGSDPVVQHTYSAEGNYNVRLRVTDNLTGTDVVSKTVSVVANQPPTASFTASPTPAVVGQQENFNASASSDPDGTIAKYEWDFDGNGTYETDAGTSPTASHTYSATGTVNVGLRVTDNGGKTATKVTPLTISPNGVSDYAAAVTGTPGVTNYWRMGESTGPTFADSVGSSPATESGGATFGVPGGVPGDPNTAARFDGSNDAASAQLNLSGTSQLTVEFWMRWTSYSNNDDLAMEFTPNFNDQDGGFLIDPNSSFGLFGVALGRGATRSAILFSRPSAGVWHHYAFTFDTTAPAASQVGPYIDGNQVPFTQIASGSGAGSFANSSLYLMSRGGTALYGAGDLDEVAVYNRALDASTISSHANAHVQNESPTASFTVSPNPVSTGATVTFNAAGSSDPDGTIAKYEWDLDGNGSYETDGGANPTTTRSYASAANVTVGLRVTDSNGGTATTTRALTVQNRAPTASFTVSPNPVSTGSNATFNAAASNDPDGTITRYEWDLDGNGSYETDTGTTATTSRSYASAATITVGLRVTDNNSATATTTRSLTVQAPNQQPTASFTVSPNPVSTGSNVTFNGSASSDPDGTITGYAWDLDGNGSYETDTGTTATTSRSYASAATITVGLRVTDNNSATATTTRSLTVQAPNQQPTASFTVSPNPVSTGSNVTFNAAASNDPDGTITRYEWDLDGNGSYETDTGTTATTSRSYASAATITVGLRVTDNNSATATTTRSLTVQAPNQQPTASFTVSPNPVSTGSNVTFNGSASSDPDGTITGYAWDLDGNGSYETNTGATATTSRSYASAATVTVGLRVTDNNGGTATTTRSLTVQNRAPTASFTVSPNPATTGATVSFNGSASADPDGTITGYAWDLDGNGSYETNTGATATTSRSYASAATVTVGLRVTDNNGGTATTTRSLTVRGSYNAAVLGTAGLIDYWRLGETSGTALADLIGARTATAQGGATLGTAGPLTNDSNTAVGFDGSNDAARTTAINLSGTSRLTVEFWMRWTTFSNNDDRAMEFTPNFSNTNGGFLVDPNASGSGNRFAVGIGRLLSRNTAYFNRPSAGVWHHYAFVFDTTAPAATQVVPYVDGQPVAYVKGQSGTGAGPFANSTLSFMSRNVASLFGAGALDEVALYSTKLSAATIAQHYAAR